MNKKSIFLVLIIFSVVAYILWIRPQPIGGGKSDLIKVSSPKILEKVDSPIHITGEARGNWFFEASFPIVLVYRNDTEGNDIVIANGHAEAKSDWMTTDFVPFEADLSFNKPVGIGSGYLILKKDNPSGLPEKDDQIEIPVEF